MFQAQIIICVLNLSAMRKTKTPTEAYLSLFFRLLSFSSQSVQCGASEKSPAGRTRKNSLTAQIRDGKREIGTLRAVGASARELTQSYFRQLLSMFGWGCGAGFGLYTFIWILMYFAAKSSDRTLDYNYEIRQAALICIALLAVCFVNLYSKVKKQMKYSIVENIREL